jgi:hypothetical protein
MAVAVLHELAVEIDAFLEQAHIDTRAADRRAQVRLSAEDASWLRGARLKYGPDVRVIDVSTGGILIETDVAPTAPQSTVVFELSAETGTMLVPARVLRSQPIEGSCRQRTACAFKRTLSIDALAAVGREGAPVPAPTAARASWQRVVARFRNGAVVRGYTNDFHPSKAHLHVTLENTDRDPVFLELSQLKAVFFVRQFAGDSSRVDRNEFDHGRHGRKIEVVFEDGEVLRGTTLAYRTDGSGFFVIPADAASNNRRVFVSPGATLEVRLL